MGIIAQDVPILQTMESIGKHVEDFRSSARSSVLGFLTLFVLFGTFILDTGLPDGIAIWVPYSTAIVLALLWDGARTIASVTAAALVLLLIGLWIGPLGDFQLAAVNRAIGAATITSLGLACLYVERTRRQLLQSHDELASSQHQLHSFVDDMHNVGIVLVNLRGRVTEWNQGAQVLTGYPSDDIKGRPLYRIFPGKANAAARWGHICRRARHERKVVRQEIFQRRDGSWCVMHMVVKPLHNRLRRHQGYSLVIHNLTSPPSLTKEGGSASPFASLLLRNTRDVLLYRCRFEPRRTLDYIDAAITQWLDDPGAGEGAIHTHALGDWVHPLDRDRAWNTIEEAVTARRPYVLVYRLVSVTGHEKWVWDEGEAVTSDDGRAIGLKGFLARL